jgi:hypothetical protein
VVPVDGDGFAEYVQQQLDEAWPGARFGGVQRNRDEDLILAAELPGGASVSTSLPGQFVRVCCHKGRANEFSRRLAGAVGTLVGLVANARSVSAG